MDVAGLCHADNEACEPKLQDICDAAQRKAAVFIQTIRFHVRQRAIVLAPRILHCDLSEHFHGSLGCTTPSAAFEASCSCDGKPEPRLNLDWPVH